MMQSWTRAVLIAVFAWNIFQANSAMAGLITLYTGAGLPSDQAWLAYADNTFITGGNASQSAVPNGVRLQADTISSAGYSNRFPNGLSKNPLFPTLDRQLGFSLAVRSANAGRIAFEQRSSRLQRNIDRFGSPRHRTWILDRSDLGSKRSTIVYTW